MISLITRIDRFCWDFFRGAIHVTTNYTYLKGLGENSGVWLLWLVCISEGSRKLFLPIVSWHLSMKEGSLFCFCFVVMRLTEPGCFRLCSWCLWKALDEEGCMALGSTMVVGLAVQKFLEYWMISSLKIKLNCSWNFWRNWNVPLLLLERCWWAGFNGI